MTPFVEEVHGLLAKIPHDAARCDAVLSRVGTPCSCDREVRVAEAVARSIEAAATGELYLEDALSVLRQAGTK